MSHFIPRRSLRSAASILGCIALAVIAGACHRSAPLMPPALARATARRHFPGVQLVDTPSGGFYVQMISGLVGKDPLYIIDGTPMHVDRSRGIDWVKPDDVLTITVLKNPVDIGMYGTQGVNGVILISTRLGMEARRRGPR